MKKDQPCPCGSGRRLSECCQNQAFGEAFGQAIILHQRGQIDDAAQRYEALLQQQPDNPDVLHYRGVVAYQNGQTARALACLERAVGLRPQAAAFRVNYGNALKAGAQLADALVQYTQAVDLDPALLGAAYARARLLRTLGRHGEAIEALRRLLTQSPGFAAAWGELGALFYEEERIDDAYSAFKNQLQIDPQNSPAWCRLGGFALRFGEHEDALNFFTQAIQCAAPGTDDRLAADTGRLFCLGYVEADGAKILAAHAEWAVARPPLAAPPQIRQRGDRLQVAFLSGDLRAHAMRFFARPLIRNIPQSPLTVAVYSTMAASQADAFTHEFQSSVGAGNWFDIAGQSDAAAAAAMRARGIDVLIDLSGLSSGNRLGVLEHHPAALQGTMLGYMTTMGSPALDFRIADRHAIPAACAGWFSEEILWLDDSQWCYVPDAGHESVGVGALPALANGQINLGAFHNTAKLTLPVLNLYVKTLQAVPTARLHLVVWGDRPKARLRKFFSAAGVGDRLVLLPPLPYADYLKYYRDIDLSFDTFPYAGGTVNCESLWMGVPVLSLAQNSPAGRGGASILSAAGLSDWVANGEDEWLDIVLKKTADIGALAACRQTLRQQVARSPLMNVEKYRQGFETAIVRHFERRGANDSGWKQHELE